MPIDSKFPKELGDSSRIRGAKPLEPVGDCTGLIAHDFSQRRVARVVRGAGTEKEEEDVLACISRTHRSAYKVQCEARKSKAGQRVCFKPESQHITAFSPLTNLSARRMKNFRRSCVSLRSLNAITSEKFSWSLGSVVVPSWLGTRRSD